MKIANIHGNWYGLYGGEDNLEYNPNPDTATLPIQDDRLPLASVFRSLDGDKVIAQIWGVMAKSFFYKDHRHENAIEAAKNFVEFYFSKQRKQTDIFD